MKSQRGYFSWVEAAMVFAIVVLIVSAYPLMNYQCASQARGLGLRHEFDVFIGCRVYVGERLVPVQMIRITDTGVVIVSGDGE